MSNPRERNRKIYRIVKLLIGLLYLIVSIILFVKVEINVYTPFILLLTSLITLGLLKLVTRIEHKDNKNNV